MDDFFEREPNASRTRCETERTRKTSGIQSQTIERGHRYAQIANRQILGASSRNGVGFSHHVFAMSLFFVAEKGGSTTFIANRRFRLNEEAENVVLAIVARGALLMSDQLHAGELFIAGRP